MNNEIYKLLLSILFILFAFLLGMAMATYNELLSPPPEHYNIQSRALNYTDKDCYTRSDVELIVFGKVLDYDKKWTTNVQGH